MTAQLDLFDLLPGTTAGQRLDAVVLAWIIQPATLAVIARAVDDPTARAELEHWGATTVNARFDGPRYCRWGTKGLTVSEWPGEQPWLMTWDRVIGAVEAASTPQQRAELVDAVAAYEECKATASWSYMSSRQWEGQRTPAEREAWSVEYRRVLCWERDAVAAILPAREAIR